MVGWIDGSSVGIAIGEGRLGAVPGKNFKTGVLVVNLSKPFNAEIVSSRLSSSDSIMTGLSCLLIRGGGGGGGGHRGRK